MCLLHNRLKLGEKVLISNLVFEKLNQKNFALILRILEPLCVCVCYNNQFLKSVHLDGAKIGVCFG